MRKAVAAVAIGAMCLSWAAPAWSDEEAALQRFVALPALDLERVVPAEGPDESKEPGPIRVGDRVRLVVIEAQRPEGAVKLALPDEADRPAAMNDNADKLMDQGVSLSFPEATEVVAVGLKAGQVSIPSLVVKDAAGKSIARTNPLQFEVVSAIAENDPAPEQVAPDRGPIALSFPAWIAVVAAVLVLLLAAAVIWALMRWSQRKRRLQAEMPAAPPRPEHEVALDALREIERADWLRKGEHKRHFFRVSEVMKAYVGARYGFDALESTSREMLASLEATQVVSAQLLDRIDELFRQLDEFKFTDRVPTVDDGARVLELAVRWVNETQRRPVVAPMTGGSVAAR